MPKYVVYVERRVPQYRTVVVEARDEEQVQANEKKIFDLASDHPEWELDWESDHASKCSRMEVCEVTDDEPDISLFSDDESLFSEDGSSRKPRQMCCDNCGLHFNEDDVMAQYPNIPDLLERMEPGCEVPFGECPDPECGALVYLKE